MQDPRARMSAPRGTTKVSSKQNKADLDRLVKLGFVTPDQPQNKNTTHSRRTIPEGGFESPTYPGFLDKPSNQGFEYSKQIDQSPGGSVWEGNSRMLYQDGGFPTWIREAISDLDVLVWWQMNHFQYSNEGSARMSVRTLSRNCGCQYRSIQRSIKRLEAVGLIRLIRRNTGRSPNQYKVITPSAIEPRILGVRRIDSGFPALDAPIEVTAESVEVTAENSIGDLTDTQKTKPLKGVVVAGSAGARPATPTQKLKNMAPAEVQTIDDVKKRKAALRNREIYSERRSTFRTFHQIEVTPERISELLENNVSLRKLFDSCINTNKEFGSFNEALGALEAGTWGSDPKKLFVAIGENLMQKSQDVTKLHRALEIELKYFLELIIRQEEKAKRDLSEWEHKQRIQKEQEVRERAREEERKQRAESERLRIEEELLPLRLSQRERLKALHLILGRMIPDFPQRVEDWGVEQTLDDYMGHVYEEAGELYDLLALMHEGVRWEELNYTQKFDFLQTWYTDTRV